MAGGVALRPLDEAGICEMKRLFLREQWRGVGLGRMLTDQIIEFAKQRGYEKMRLDTEKRLKVAITLYRNVGFIDINKYYENPLEGIIYMEKDLTL